MAVVTQNICQRSISIPWHLCQLILFNALLMHCHGLDLNPIQTEMACEDYSDDNCDEMPVECLTCNYNSTCIYGQNTTANCTVLNEFKCKGDRQFLTTLPCRYCYLTPKEMHICSIQELCKVNSNPRKKMLVNCTVGKHVYCIGKRNFLKSLPCNWSSGYRWSTSILLSITLGGFGVDRFYLGHWREGLGKLFSFGGLGVWTLVDIILIAVGYIRPHDGSLYIF